MTSTPRITLTETREEQHSLYRPKQAVVMYSNGTSQFTALHPIQEGEGGPALGAAQALAEPLRRQLLLALQGHDMTLTSPETLAVSATGFAWWCPPGRRALNFDPKYAQTGSVTRFNDVPLPHPGLVFLTANDALYVYAVAGCDRPITASTLCYAPYWNLFEDHRMCRGTVTYPAPRPEFQSAWENAFFASLFTGPSRTVKDSRWGGSYDELLAHIQQLGIFPDDLLLPANVTLGQRLLG